MFNNYEQIKRRIDSIQEELKHIEKLKKEFPKENLICAKNNQYYKWYLRTEAGTTYLPKQNKDTAQAHDVAKENDMKSRTLERFLNDNIGVLFRKEQSCRPLLHRSSQT